MVGTITLLAAFILAALSTAAGIVGNARQNPRLVRASVHGLYAFAALVAVTSGLLIYAFVTHDYTIRYVADTSDTSMSISYKITSFWGALEGSLLFWVLVLALFSAIAIRVNERRHRDMIGYVVAVILVVEIFFLSVLIFDKNPFATFLTAPPTDGEGLNPALQNYWMVIHPPALYTGFVSATIPFAFAIGALASGRLDDNWLASVRSWALICFFFLSFGLILGGRWAYEVLGWGGYWAWDPVENAGFMPWFTITAFLHTAIIQEQRGMLKVWNLVLVILTFFLTIFGTFMTRSGVVQSVHAFGQDSVLALQFVVFMAFLMIVSLGLLIHRLPRLRKDGALESFVSREFAFLVNNWILLACAFFVWFVTMLPTITEALFGERITIGAAFFNRWMTPLGLALLFLAGAAPLLAWRKTTRERLYQQFLWPTAAMVVTMIALALFLAPTRALTPILHDAIKLPIPLLSFGLCAFTVGSIVQEFVRGTAARRRQSGSGAMTSLIGIVLAKRRKYGGYVVHLGVVLLIFGFTGKTWNGMADRTIKTPASMLRAQGLPVKDATFHVRGYTFVYEGLSQDADDAKLATTAHVTLYDGSDKLELLHPARWQYRKGKQTDPVTRAAIHERIGEDVYVVLTGYDVDSQLANFRIFINPLVNWVWIGFVVLALGTFICLIPQSVVDAVLGKKAARMGEAALVLLVAGALLGGGVRVAHAQDDGAGGNAPAEHQDEIVRAQGHNDDSGWASRYRPDSALAEELMKDLVCMCDGCKRETLYDCKCGVAAMDRKKILEMLAREDLTTSSGRAKARRAVIDEFVSHYGGEQVLANPRGSYTWMLPYLAVVGGLVALILTGRGMIRRSASATPVVAPASGTPDDERLAEKLDDEIRDAD
ncbi:MAG TPA: cytochrome c-type biogenesis CcmF C-terminal domain-containing protein [Kofleriaceae bacterium]|nr:cytochrome c-type biogenesis CcmF C-terminal domain-containing protein [Kofleriaceae bacterium]